MKKISILFAVLLVAAASAQDPKVGTISIGHPWARATPGAVKNSAAFMVFDNQGTADKLISVTGDIAKDIQIHSMITEA
ncbi:MAG: copper chaperone PCu(A)C, partial [Rhizobacter sp.]|nr:copper chaperone PCu(A)C [Burkholderiales bacterium]